MGGAFEGHSAGWLALAMVGAGLVAGCAEPAEQDDPVVVVPGDAAPDGSPVDMQPMDMGRPDAALDMAPARMLIQRGPLPSPAENRILNPGFDIRSPASWITDPMGARIVDHRLPFDGPALLINDAGEPSAFYGRVRLSSAPIALDIWIGVDPGDLDPEDAHRAAVLAELYAFTPGRDAVMPIVYQLLPSADPVVVGPRGLIWRKFGGGTRRPTLGWGWLLLRGASGRRMAIAEPVAIAEPLTPSALRQRPPAMPIHAADPAVLARLGALNRPPPPREPRPVSAGPRGMPPRR